MRDILMLSGIRQALVQEMRRDDKAFLIGEDVTKGCFGVSAGLVGEFGPNRIIDTAISEKGIMGAAIGAAAMGMTAVAEMMFGDFVFCCYDEIVNQAAKMRYMFGGQASLNLTVRMPNGVSQAAGAQHSQSVEAMFTHIPGLKVVYPSQASDCAGLLVTAMRDPNPVIFLEHKRQYFMQFPVPWGEDEEIPAIPFGKASVRREGKDITIVATGMCVSLALAAAEELSKSGIDCEVIDPRTLFPLDKEAIFESLEKTGKLLVVTEEPKRGAWSETVVAEIAEERFGLLKKAPVRIGALDTPIPYSPQLEAYAIPRVEDIIMDAAKLAK